MRLVDSHAHLQADAFADDVEAVLLATSGAAVERVLVPGWDAASSAAALELAAGRGWLDAAAGIHPHEAAAASDADWATIVRLAGEPGVVAIGETGLDFDRLHAPAEAQLANLRRHLRLALDTARPAILHCRSPRDGHEAQDALLAELRAAGFGGPASRAAFGERPPAVLHSFSGGLDYGLAALDLGLAISFSGLVFRSGEDGSAILAPRVPVERLLVETDSPFLPPPGVPRRSGPRFRGRRNEPQWVRVTLNWLAECREVAPDVLGEQVLAAYDRTFRDAGPPAAEGSG